MKVSTTPELVHAMVDLSAMVFAAKLPEDALDSLALALDVQSAMVVRHDTATERRTILIQNDSSSRVRSRSRDLKGSEFVHLAMLEETSNHRDVLVLQTRLSKISASQRAAIEDLGPYLQTLWASRSAVFEQALKAGRSPTNQSVLHPDNPFDLTQTELRVCGLIASGHRPAAMAHVMKISMSTVRTHLRSIYTKTGLDGMIGVLRNIQTHADNQKIAG